MAESSCEKSDEVFRDDDASHSSATMRFDTDGPNHADISKEILSFPTKFASQKLQLAKMGDWTVVFEMLDLFTDTS